MCNAGTLSCFTKTHYNLRESHTDQAMTKCRTREKKSKYTSENEGPALGWVVWQSANLCSSAMQHKIAVPQPEKYLITWQVQEANLCLHGATEKI